MINDELQNRPPPRSPSSLSTSFPNQTKKQSVSSIKAYIQSRTHRVTATLLLVSCSFVLLNTPYCVVWIANYLENFGNATLKSVKEITELFMLTNFCINFLLYCVSGKAFRNELAYILRCRWRELYDRSEAERAARKKSRPKIEIQLNETKLKPRALSCCPNDQPCRTSSYALYTNKNLHR